MLCTSPPLGRPPGPVLGPPPLPASMGPQSSPVGQPPNLPCSSCCCLRIRRFPSQNVLPTPTPPAEPNLSLCHLLTAPPRRFRSGKHPCHHQLPPLGTPGAAHILGAAWRFPPLTRWGALCAWEAVGPWLAVGSHRQTEPGSNPHKNGGTSGQLSISTTCSLSRYKRRLRYNLSLRVLPHPRNKYL